MLKSDYFLKQIQKHLAVMHLFSFVLLTYGTHYIYIHIRAILDENELEVNPLPPLRI